MIAPPPGMRVRLSTGGTDLRRSVNGLALQVQEALHRDPHAGDLYVFQCAPNGAVTLWVEVPSGQWSVGPVAGRRFGWATGWIEALRQRPLLGGRANRRAVMRVKPEQASKGKLWTPTRPKRGEGSTILGSSRQMRLDRSTGVVGTARRDRGSRKRGRSVRDEGSGRNGAARHRSARKSDRGVVPLKPGNAGGGKGPDFWYVFEADEVG
jgi:IS66 Orf2 like protein